MIAHNLSDISLLFRGNKKIVRVYIGDKMIYPKEQKHTAFKFNSFISYNNMARFNSSNKQK